MMSVNNEENFEQKTPEKASTLKKIKIEKLKITAITFGLARIGPQ